MTFICRASQDTIFSKKWVMKLEFPTAINYHSYVWWKRWEEMREANTLRTAPVHLVPGMQPIYWETAFLNKFYLVENNTCTGIISVHLLLYYIMWHGQRDRGKFPLCSIRNHYMKTGTERSGLQFLARHEISFFSKMSRMAVWPSQLPIQWVLVVLSLSKAERKWSCPLIYSIWCQHYEWGDLYLCSPCMASQHQHRLYLYGIYKHGGLKC